MFLGFLEDGSVSVADLSLEHYNDDSEDRLQSQNALGKSSKRERGNGLDLGFTFCKFFFTVNVRNIVVL